jgi:hypothetical protein
MNSLGGGGLEISAQATRASRDSGKTAKALGLNVPQALRATASEAIE